VALILLLIHFTKTIRLTIYHQGDWQRSLLETKGSVVVRVGRPYRLYPKVSDEFPVADRKRFSRL